MCCRTIWAGGGLPLYGCRHHSVDRFVVGIVDGVGVGVGVGVPLAGVAFPSWGPLLFPVRVQRIAVGPAFRPHRGPRHFHLLRATNGCVLQLRVNGVDVPQQRATVFAVPQIRSEPHRMQERSVSVPYYVHGVRQLGDFLWYRQADILHDFHAVQSLLDSHFLVRVVRHAVHFPYFVLQDRYV